ncbi:DUF4135 domain-containing protein [Bacillus licheniformis]|nr:DUF4135 domain-containing protein [Bacillus licheniformis]
MMKHKEELAGPSWVLNLFKHDEVRHVFRPTHVYGKFLEASTHPDYLTAGDKREQLFDYMWMLAKQSERQTCLFRTKLSICCSMIFPTLLLCWGTSLLNSRGEESEGFMKHQVLIWQRKIQSFSERI